MGIVTRPERKIKTNANKWKNYITNFVFPLQWHVNIFRIRPNDILSVKCDEISCFIRYGNLSYIESQPTQLVKLITHWSKGNIIIILSNNDKIKRNCCLLFLSIDMTEFSRAHACQWKRKWNALQTKGNRDFFFIYELNFLFLYCCCSDAEQSSSLFHLKTTSWDV